MGPDLDGDGPAVDIAGLRHEHAALVYDGEADRLRAVLPFVREALARGERCLYVVDGGGPEGIGALIERHLPGGGAALRSGQVQVLAAGETLLRRGPGDPEGMIAWVADAVRGARVDGWSGLRLTVESTWALAGHPRCERLHEYESRLNGLFTEPGLLVLCQYDRRRFGAAQVRATIATHPVVVWGDCVCRNPHYVPPEEYLGPHAAEREVDRVLHEIRLRARHEQELRDGAARQRGTADRLARLNRLYSVLSSVNEALVRTPQPDALFRKVCRIAVDVGGFKLAWAGRVAESGRIVPVASWGFDDGYLARLRVAALDRPEGRGPTGTAVRTGAHVVCHDIASDPSMAPWRDEALRRGFLSAAAFPLRAGGRTIGVLVLYAATTDAFDDEHVRLLDALADDVSYALDSAERDDLLRQAQKMEAVGRLAGGVAHDFNNVLGVVIGYGDMLLRSFDAADPRAPRMREIVRAAERAAGLTRQLLAFARRDVVQPRVLDLNALVLDTESMLRRLIGERVALETRLGADVGAIRADPGQIDQVLMNLVVNARDAMPGGGTVTITTRALQVDEVRARHPPHLPPGSWVVLSVADTGVGMDAETQARVFEPFFTTRELGHGTGLGLATVYGIVQQCGGEVRVVSAPGQGATFEVFFPRVDGVPSAPASRAGPADAPRGTEVVLLAEDDDAFRAVVEEMLRDAGYTVLSARGASDALRVGREHAGDIHLLVTDVVMPEMNGRELARLLGTARPGVRVLYLSGYPDDAIVQEGVLEPGLAFLQKPFAPDALARKLREVLGRP